jgi:hypothetical protein
VRPWEYDLLSLDAAEQLCRFVDEANKPPND